MHCLGTLYQYQGVDYVKHDDDGSVRCLLCGTGWMFRDQRIEHFHGTRHERNYNAVKEAEEEAEEAEEAERTTNAEEWMHCLGTLYQYQGVDYVEHDDDGSVRCLLCDTGWMFRDQRIEHFHGARHERNYNAVKEAEEEAEEAEEAETRALAEKVTAKVTAKIEAQLARAGHARKTRCFSTIEWFQSYVERVASLGLPRWQHHVQSQMFRSFFPGGACGSTLCDSGMTEEHKCSTLSLLLKYERREALSLLELALWKASIVSPGLFLSVREMKEYPVLDRDFDAQEYAARRREACGSAVVIPLVVTFLQHEIPPPIFCTGFCQYC